jgi:hypothetical protein
LQDVETIAEEIFERDLFSERFRSKEDGVYDVTAINVHGASKGEVVNPSEEHVVVQITKHKSEVQFSIANRPIVKYLQQMGPLVINEWRIAVSVRVKYRTSKLTKCGSNYIPTLRTSHIKLTDN